MISDHLLLNAVLRTDFYAFARRVFREVLPGQIFEDSWAVEAICHVLEEVAHGRRRRQIITVPPRSLKSICASVALPAWILGHDPTAKIIAVSYGQDLADYFSAMCRQVMKATWYRELFPGTAISPFKDSESYFRTIAGGFRNATSIGGSLTGKGGDLIIIDDPGKSDGVMSQSIRESINDWYGRTLVSRLDNKLTGRILLVMQRLHLEDLVGHVQRHEDWDVLTLPAIAAMEELVPLAHGRFHVRAPGSVLRPNSDTLEVLRQYELNMGSHAFSAQYLQQPIPTNGEIIKLAWFKYYLKVLEPPYSIIVQSWDTATKAGPRTDYSSCVTAAVNGDSIQIIDVYRARLDFPSLRNKAIEMARRDKADRLLIEDVGAGASLRQQLKEERNPGVPDPIPIVPRDDKATRMMTASPIVQAGHVSLPVAAPWLKAFLDELAQFPEGAYKDQADAFSQLLNWNYRRLHHGARAERRSMFGHALVE